MAEDATQSEVESTVAEAVATVEVPANTTASETTVPETSPANNPVPVIWTPRFIVVFALVLTGVLSIANLLVQGYLNNYYPAERILLVYDAIVFCGWAALVVCTRIEWMRVGGLFGCTWAIFTAMNLVVTLLATDPTSRTIVAAHLHAATGIALLGCFICLSISGTPLRRWDNWFFVAMPLLGIGIIAVWFLRFSPVHTLKNFENIVATVSYFCCLAIWWGRPSCWRHQPGPAFLLGLVPLIQLWITLPGTQIVSGDTHFFYSQVIQLCILLAIMRLVQAEIRYAAIIARKQASDDQRLDVSG